MRFIPVDFSKTGRIIWQAHVCKAFQFSPATSAMFLLQPIEVANGVADCNDLNVRDFTEHFDIVVRHINIIHRTVSSMSQFVD